MSNINLSTTITITTPENIEIKYRLAGLGSRAAAAFIDMLIISFAVALMAFALVSIGFRSTFGGFEIGRLSGWPIAVFIIAASVVYFGYFIISEMCLKGQSIGKKILKLRVIRQNGQPITFFQSLVRNLFRYFLDMYCFGIICIFFNKQHKRIGDMAASTIVISENPYQLQAQNLKALDLLPSDSVVLTSDKYIISHEELNTLKEYFSRRNQFLDNGEHVKKMLIAYFSKKFTIPDGRLDDVGLEKIMQINQ